MKPSRNEVRALRAAADAAWDAVEAVPYESRDFDRLYREYDEAVLYYLDAEDARAWFWTSRRRAKLSNLYWALVHRFGR